MLILKADLNKYTWWIILIEFEGLGELLESIENLADTDNIEAAITKGCMLVERTAKQKASIGKGDGELARSITSTVNGLTGEVFTPLEYAPYVEYGTGKYAEGGKGRQDVPWVYVEGSGSGSGKSTQSYTLEEAKNAVRFLREQGLDAYYTYGQHPRPYMRPALDENRDNILRLIKEGLIK